jgi:SAM-dependent methyltransferase
MAPLPFFKKPNIEPLALSMSGVRMGERVLQLGIDDPSLVGGIAAKVGMSGHAAAAVTDDAAAAKVRSAAERGGALIDVRTSPLTALPFDDGGFDVVIVHGRQGLLASLDDHTRTAALREGHRVLRHGGRIVIIEAGAGGGLGSMFRGTPAARTDTSALAAAGFKAPRVLAEREGFTFTEALKAS